MFNRVLNHRRTRTSSTAAPIATRPPCVLEPLEGRQLLSAAQPFDLNGDGHPDLVWRNTGNGNGANSVWLMDGHGQVLANGFKNLTAVPANSGWGIVGSADFNQDGHADLVWFNNVTKGVSIWYMGGADGTTLLSTPLLGQFTIPNTVAAGVGDINGDGHPDIMFRNVIQGDGRNYFWLMGGTDGSQVLDLTQTTPVPDNAWSVVGLGDVDGNGTTDIVWHNSHGYNSIWFMNGTSIVTHPYTSSSNDVDYGTPSAVEDLNSDGRADIVLRNYTPNTAKSGQIQIWIPNTSGTIFNILLPPVQTNLDWQIIGSQLV